MCLDAKRANNRSKPRKERPKKKQNKIKKDTRTQKEKQPPSWSTCVRCFHSIVHRRQNHTPHHSNRQHFILFQRNLLKEILHQKKKKGNKKKTRKKDARDAARRKKTKQQKQNKNRELLQQKKETQEEKTKIQPAARFFSVPPSRQHVGAATYSRGRSQSTLDIPKTFSPAPTKTEGTGRS